LEGRFGAESVYWVRFWRGELVLSFSVWIETRRLFSQRQLTLNPFWLFLVSFMKNFLLHITRQLEHPAERWYKAEMFSETKSKRSKEIEG
jgi:hypothetical protein